MLGSRHPPAPKLFFNFSGILGRRGGLFLIDCDGADVTHIFKGKGKPNRIKKYIPHVTFFVFLWNLVPFCKIYLWGKDVFTFYQHCVKSVQIQSEYRKIRTRNSFVFRHFSRSARIAVTTTGDWWNQRKKPSKAKFDYRKKRWKWTDGLLCPWNL